MSKKVAIIGFGFMGRVHYGCWKKIRGAQLVALCDQERSRFQRALTGDKDKAADISLDYGAARLYADTAEMLATEKPDIVDITLPTFLHLPLVAQALQAGADVICEKPMALDSVSCVRMLQAAKASGRRLVIAQCVRFFPAYAYVKGLLENGKYGRALAASFYRSNVTPGGNAARGWFADETKSGGLALDMHIHDIDFICWAFGCPRSVTSRAEYAADGAMRYITTAYDVGGPVVTATGSWVQTPTAGFEAGFTVSFEKAVVECDGRRAAPLMVYPAVGKPFAPKLSPKSGYQLELEWFFKSLSGREVPATTTPEESARAVRVAEAEKKSAKTGRTISIPKTRSRV